jgi:hypothetical protein
VPVKIPLSCEQITGNGKHKILLSENQKKKNDKSKKLKKEMNYNWIINK